MKNKTKLSLWERYLTKEIGIEFKSCLYFFADLFFYCMFRIITGRFDASILHMAELIFARYLLCYVQVFLLWNFDEAEELGGKEIIGMTLCTVGYTCLGAALGWFEGNLWVNIGFGAYVLFTYVMMFFVNRTKRRIDDKKLNKDLMLFQARINLEDEDD